MACIRSGEIRHAGRCAACLPCPGKTNFVRSHSGYDSSGCDNHSSTHKAPSKMVPEVVVFRESEALNRDVPVFEAIRNLASLNLSSV